MTLSNHWLVDNRNFVFTFNVLGALCQITGVNVFYFHDFLFYYFELLDI